MSGLGLSGWRWGLVFLEFCDFAGWIRDIHKEGMGLGGRNGYWSVMIIGYDTMTALLFAIVPLI